MTDFAAATIEWGTAPDSITLLELAKNTLGMMDNSEDATLSMYLNMAGNAAERYIDNILDQREVTEQISRTLSPVALRYWPVGALTSVVVDGEDKTQQYQQLFDDGIGWVNKPSTSETSQFIFSCVAGQMNITYTAGYDPLPTEVGYAIVQAALAYRSSAAAGGVSSIIKKESIVGVGSIDYDTTTLVDEKVGLLPSSVTAVLEPYRRVGA